MAQIAALAARTYKDRLFRMIFSDKGYLLMLYNALNRTCYKNPEVIQFNTLTNAIYMSMHNDLSFVIALEMELFEHQSSWNPNMPLRFFLYLADIYSELIKDKNLYGKYPVMLPEPRFIVFYNGTDMEMGDRTELQLSDVFQTKREDGPWLDLKALVLNINRGFNKELMETCRPLRDYAEYVARLRDYARTMPISEAVEKTVGECIRERILADFLSKNRAEAVKVSIYEYDEEEHMRMERIQNYEKGMEDGLKEGRKEGIKEGIQKGSLSLLTDLVHGKLLTLEQAAEQMALSTEEFVTRCREYKLNL